MRPIRHRSNSQNHAIDRPPSSSRSAQRPPSAQPVRLRAHGRSPCVRLPAKIRAQVPTNLNTLNMNAASAAYLGEQVAKAQSHQRKKVLRLELAIQLLRAGQTREAISELHFLQAQDLPPDLHTRVRDRLGMRLLAPRRAGKLPAPPHHRLLFAAHPKAKESTPCKKAHKAAIEQYAAALHENPDGLSAPLVAQHRLYDPRPVPPTPFLPSGSCPQSALPTPARSNALKTGHRA